MRRTERRLRILALRLRRRFNAGLALSLALHAAVIALLLMRVGLPAAPQARLLVDLVLPGEGADAGDRGAGGTTAADTAPSPKVAPAPRAPRTGSPRPPALGELLRHAEAAHGTPAPASRDTGGGTAGAGASDGRGAGGQGRRGLEDFIRAQIERRWQFERTGGREIVVRIRLRIESDGTVASAEIVDDTPADPGVHGAAIGARNAALLSSPLQLPSGAVIAERDITVDLNTKDALR